MPEYQAIENYWNILKVKVKKSLLRQMLGTEAIRPLEVVVQDCIRNLLLYRSRRCFEGARLSFLVLLALHVDVVRSDLTLAKKRIHILLVTDQIAAILWVVDLDHIL